MADAFLQNPKEIPVSRPASVATTIIEGLVLVAEHDKRESLRRLIRTQKVQNALIFCNRKRDVDILHKSLTRHGFNAGALHGDMAQTVRFATLEKFRAGELRLLVCSDVAARGLDIGGLSHVFNFDVPHHAEDYVHRIGRTGRAGLEGHAFTIATPEDRLAVEAIEKLIATRSRPLWSRGSIRWHGPRTMAGAAAADAAGRLPNARLKPRNRPRKPSLSVPSRAGKRLRSRKRPDLRQRRDRPVAPRSEAAEPRPEPVAERARPAAEPASDVTGFGGDIPAFMLVRPRASRAAPVKDLEAEA